MTLTFTVPIVYWLRTDKSGRHYHVGDVQGRPALTHRGKWTQQATAYVTWARRVEWAAFRAGFMSVPLPTSSRHGRVDIACFFRRGHNPEPENVRKGVVDALYYPKWLPLVLRMKREFGGVRHLDRWVTEGRFSLEIVDERPRVEVTVEVPGSTTEGAEDTEGKQEAKE